MNKYIQPDIDGHKVLYKGRRYWVFEVSKTHPYRGYENIASFVFYDGLLDIDMGWGHINEKGQLEGSIPYGQHSLDVREASIRELLRSMAKEAAWEMNHS